MNCLKHIPLKGAYNVRDLGGYPTQDGRMTRWGVLYRSDALHGLADEDWGVLQRRNVKTIVDLRSQSEREAARICVPKGMACYSFSLMNQLDRMGRDRSRESILESMKLDYEKTLFGNLSGCADIFRTLLERMQEGAVLFLCSAGKDRTGMVAALALYLCRVAREDIVADYMVSSTYNANGINKKLANIPEEMRKLIPDMELLRECLDSKPETVIKLLDALEERNIGQCLEDAGFSRELQERFRQELTVPVAE